MRSSTTATAEAPSSSSPSKRIWFSICPLCLCLRGRRCGRPLVGPAKRVHWPGSVSHPPQKHRQHRASLNICVRMRTAGICAASLGASSSCTPYPGRVVCVCIHTSAAVVREANRRSSTTTASKGSWTLRRHQDLAAHTHNYQNSLCVVARDHGRGLGVMGIANSCMWAWAPNEVCGFTGVVAAWPA